MTTFLNPRTITGYVFLLFNFIANSDAVAQSHLEIVKNTPCLLEYRTYIMFGSKWGSGFPTPSNFTKEECENAIVVHGRIQGEQAAHTILMDKYARRANENERKTECLLEYRIWHDDYSNGQSFEDALGSFAGFKMYDRDSCVSAKQTYERFAAEKIATAIREKRAAEVERKAEIQQQAKRDAFARRPGVKIGMTPDEVVEKSNWGRPQKKNRTTTTHGISEQWVYGNGNYLYFENGRLTAIQN